MRTAVSEPGLTVNPHPIAQSKTTHDFRRHENIIRGLNEIAFRVAQKAETLAGNLDDAVAELWLALELTIFGGIGGLILIGTLLVISRTCFGPGASPASVYIRHNLICRAIEIATLLVLRASPARAIVPSLESPAGTPGTFRHRVCFQRSLVISFFAHNYRDDLGPAEAEHCPLGVFLCRQPGQHLVGNI